MAQLGRLAGFDRVLVDVALRRVVRRAGEAVDEFVAFRREAHAVEVAGGDLDPLAVFEVDDPQRRLAVERALQRRDHGRVRRPGEDVAFPPRVQQPLALAQGDRVKPHFGAARRFLFVDQRFAVGRDLRVAADADLVRALAAVFGVVDVGLLEALGVGQRRAGGGGQRQQGDDDEEGGGQLQLRQGRHGPDFIAAGGGPSELGDVGAERFEGEALDLGPAFGAAPSAPRRRRRLPPRSSRSGRSGRRR